MGVSSYPKKKDMLLETVNCTSWGPMHVRAGLSTASIVAVQGHHMHLDSQLDQASKLLSKAGWAASWAKAVPTGRGGTSGGVAILWRKHLQAVGQAQVLSPARCIAQPFRHSALGIIWVYSVYMFVGEKQGPRNADILHELLAHAAKHALPYVAAGDFNMEPALLQSMLVGHLSNAKVFASCVASCSGTSNIDYFFAHLQLVPFCSTPWTVMEASTSPHSPVAVKLLAAVAQVKVQVFSCPPRASPGPVIGPHLQPPAAWEDWQEIMKKAGSLTGQDKLDFMFKAWNIRAYAEAAPLGTLTSGALPWGLYWPLEFLSRQSLQLPSLGCRGDSSSCWAS